RIVLASAFGALLASGLFDGPLMSFVSADQVSQPANITTVNRTGKGDRWRAPEPGTTIIIRRETPATRDASDPKLVPTSISDCEPLASPYADPRLGKFAGRCYV